MSNPRKFLLAFLLTLAALDVRADADPPKIAPEGPVWSVGAGFQFDGKADKKRESRAASLARRSRPFRVYASQLSMKGSRLGT